MRDYIEKLMEMPMLGRLLVLGVIVVGFALIAGILLKGQLTSFLIKIPLSLGIDCGKGVMGVKLCALLGFVIFMGIGFLITFIGWLLVSARGGGEY